MQTASNLPVDSSFELNINFGFYVIKISFNSPPIYWADKVKKDPVFLKERPSFCGGPPIPPNYAY